MGGDNFVSVVEIPSTLGITENPDLKSGGEPEAPPKHKVYSRYREVHKNGGILITFFSHYGNTEYPGDVDATTSASIVADKRDGMVQHNMLLI